MRRPQDRLGQRELVYEMKHAIDRCMRRPSDPMARQHLDEVIAQNPRSAQSRHVLHNIGVIRREWLEARVRAGSLPSPREPALVGAAKSFAK